MHVCCFANCACSTHMLKSSASIPYFMPRRGRAEAGNISESEICSALSGLSVSGSGNVVNVHISTGSGSSSSSRVPAGGDGAAAAKPKAAPKAPAALKDSRRYYIILRCHRNPSICGLWHCTWGFLAGRLPGGKLWGSTASPETNVHTQIRGYTDQGLLSGFRGLLLARLPP